MHVSPQPPFTLLDLAVIGALGILSLMLICMAGLAALWAALAMLDEPKRTIWLMPVALAAIGIWKDAALYIAFFVMSFVLATFALHAWRAKQKP